MKHGGCLSVPCHFSLAVSLAPPLHLFRPNIPVLRPSRARDPDLQASHSPFHEMMENGWKFNTHTPPPKKKIYVVESAKSPSINNTSF